MKLLLLPGIGDVHWVALKLEAFARAHGCVRPDVYIWNFDGRPRTLPFVERMPFVRAAGYHTEPVGRDQKLFHRMYMTGEADIARNFRGFDAFICVNGSLRMGKPWATILPEYETNWNYAIENRAGDREVFPRAPYFLFNFSSYGMFQKHWAKDFPPARVSQLLSRIRQSFPSHQLIATGCEWDREYLEQVAGFDSNVAGLTSFGQLLALIRSARAFVGWCGGNTILSAHLGTPTLMLWHKYFPHKGFWTNWIHPSRVGTTYHPADVSTVTDDTIVAKLKGWGDHVCT